MNILTVQIRQFPCWHSNRPLYSWNPLLQKHSICRCWFFEDNIQMGRSHNPLPGISRYRSADKLEKFSKETVASFLGRGQLLGTNGSYSSGLVIQPVSCHGNRRSFQGGKWFSWDDAELICTASGRKSTGVFIHSFCAAKFMHDRSGCVKGLLVISDLSTWTELTGEPSNGVGMGMLLETANGLPEEVG